MNQRTENPGLHGGYYAACLRKTAPLWAASGLLALLCTLISYPGIWYSDSYVRVATGNAVLNAVIQALKGHPITLETGNAFTVVPSFFIALCLGLTGQPALYTFCQAFFFFAAVFLLIRDIASGREKTQTVLFALSPLVWGASVYCEANIGSVIGLIALVLLFRRLPVKKNRGVRAAEFLLIALSSLVTFGYRTNALTVLPVLGVYIWKTRQAWKDRLHPLLAVLCGLVIMVALPRVFGIRSQSNAGTGFVWEMITVIQRLPPEDRETYLDYLDDIGGEGATRAVVASSTEASANDFMWGSAINLNKLSAPGAMGRVLTKYLRMLREKPLECLRVKADFVLRAMGIPEALNTSEYDYNRWDAMGEYGFNDSRQRQFFHSSFLRFHAALGFYTLRPWVPFLLSLILLLAERRRKSRNAGLYTLLFWLAAFYYCAYLTVIVGFELRFFYPALLLLSILDCAVFLDWARDGWHYLMKKKG